MSTETKTIGAMRSSNAATDIAYTSDFNPSQKKKSKGLRSGDRGTHKIVSLCEIYHTEYVAWRWLRPAIQNCAGVLLCMNHTFWCTVASIATLILPI
ncbi:hypothetical protein TNCV_4119561 [Trichonephila clavipes]|nr:hypothetical protein TNCV_4119561 [Trichonephila clavipes]